VSARPAADRVAVQRASEGILAGLGRVRNAFALMEVAEEEIAQVWPRAPGTPARDVEPASVFLLVRPTPLVGDKSTEVYRSHVREMLERVTLHVARKPHTAYEFGTEAECLVALVEQSLRAPLAHDFQLVYEHLFAGVLPGEAKRLFPESQQPRRLNQLERVDAGRLRDEVLRLLCRQVVPVENARERAAIQKLHRRRP